MNKYKNRKTTIDGITFDSKLEAERYAQLKLLMMAKEISHLMLQPKYLLQEAFEKNGKKHRAIHYVADFEYWCNRKNKRIVEDVKGVQTEAFKIKYKIFEYKYPDLQLSIITKKDI